MKKKTSVFTTLGASNHVSADRQHEDYYATDPAATEWLCRLERFGNMILEPCCGGGHISKVLASHGYDVTSRDLYNHGYGASGIDFLSIDNQLWIGDIVTNPPYRYAQEFVEKSLQIIPESNKVAMFLKLTFLEGKARKVLFRNFPPVRIWVSSSRLQCGKNGEFEELGSNAIAYAWFIWVKGYKGKTEIRWFN